MKGSGKPYEKEDATMAIVLLRVASVLGREFQLDALRFISPLHKDSYHDKRVADAIRLLEKKDLLEIVD